MNHSFDVNIAKKYGIEEAILLQHIYFWIEKNKANEKHFYNGTYWTYSTKKALAVLFPYLTPRKIDYALNNLIENGLIITGYFNEKPTDRTLWYALTKMGYCILQNCEMEETKLENDNNIYNNTNANVENTNIEESIINNTKENSKRFKKPTLEELEAYINEKGYHFSASNFINYYDSVGWKIGKSPMKDWKAACRTWEAKYKNDNNGKCYKPKEISRETSYPEYDDVGYIR